MLLFTYQSYLWNEGVRRYLQLLLPRESLFPMPYQAGTLLFHRDATPEVLRTLREATFPLLGPGATFSDPTVKQAVDWVLGREKLTLEDMRIEEAPQLLFFKHEERPVLSFPQKLVIGKARPDELNRGHIKVNVAFTLPPGAYATLVVKRLFHFGWKEDTREQIFASQRPRLAEELEAGSRDDGPRRDTRPSTPTRSKTPTRASRPEADGAPLRASRHDKEEAAPRRASRYDKEAPAPARASRYSKEDAAPRRATRQAPEASAPARPARPEREAPARAAPAEAPARPLGFLERQRLKKSEKARKREEAPKSPKSQRKK
jgi:tRNA pseudouridine13 synthase